MRSHIKKLSALFLAAFLILSLFTVSTAAKTYMLGDVNGDTVVNSTDAAAVLRHTVHLRMILEEYLPYADVNYDKDVNAGDAAMILRYTVHLIHGFTERKVSIDLLATSDVHGQLYNTDYTSGESGTLKYSMLQAATLVKQRRADNDNVLLLDVGDTVQGTPLTAYYALTKGDVADPVMKTLRLMHYDAMVLGNHEFNYGLTVLNRQLSYLTSPESSGETPVEVLAANYRDAEAEDITAADATWQGYKPYILKTYDNGLGETFTVAIIGLANPNIDQWEVESHYAGINMMDLAEAYAIYEEELTEKADFIIAAVHSGIESKTAVNDLGENQVRSLLASTNSIDLVLSGHAHSTGTVKIEDKDGNEVPVLSLDTKAKTIGEVVIDYNFNTQEVSFSCANVSLSNLAADADLKAAIEPYEDSVWADYLNIKIGVAAEAFPNGDYDGEPTALMELINKAQIFAIEKETETVAGLIEDNDAYDKVISISGPVTSAFSGNAIDKGDITMADMFTLYKYENWLYGILMQGKEVKAWLDLATGNLGGSWYFDTLYGLNYTLDPNQDPGSRCTKLTYPDGTDVADTDVFLVAINNYRYAGGCDYIKVLDTTWMTLEDRTFYYSGSDFGANEDEGQVRNILAEYIKAQKDSTITPSIDFEWTVEKASAKTMTIAAINTAIMTNNATGQYVKTTGTVTYVSGKNCYIEDAGGAVLLYNASTSFSVSVGDAVTVQGITANYLGKPELGSCEVLSSAAGTAVTPAEVTVADIAANGIASYNCRLIKVTGVLGAINTSGTTTLAAVDDAAVTINIYKFPSGTSFKEGDAVTIVGIVSPYNASVQIIIMSGDYISLAEKP